MSEPDAPIAVTVVGGYLGAGKTTLLNHILRTATERIAVLVNDFGDINIDEALIESDDGDTMSLANGCICCSLVDGFAAALDTVLALSPRPDRLVIEASGVADPATVAAWGHGPGLELNATVVVADAETVRTKARDKYVGDTVLAQLAAADIVVLNKADLCSADALEATTAWLEEQSGGALVVSAENAEVDPVVLFGIEPRPAAPDRPHLHAHDLFDTWDWSPDGPQQRPDVEQLMADQPDSIVRAKGIVWLEDEPDHQTVLQRVGGRWTLRRGRPWAAVPYTQVVFIGLRSTIDADH